MQKVSRENKLSITYSTIAAWITIVPAVWLMAKPIMTTSVAKELKEQLRQQIQREVSPLSESFAVMLRQSITQLRRRIATAEFRWEEARRGVGEWTAQDARDLAELRVELRVTEEALAALERND